MEQMDRLKAERVSMKRIIQVKTRAAVEGEKKAANLK